MSRVLDLLVELSVTKKSDLIMLMKRVWSLILPQLRPMFEGCSEEEAAS